MPAKPFGVAVLAIASDGACTTSSIHVGAH